MAPPSVNSNNRGLIAGQACRNAGSAITRSASEASPQCQNTSEGSGTTSRAARATTWLLPHSAAVAIRAADPRERDAAFISVPWSG
jgi:hypothetical protein